MKDVTVITPYVFDEEIIELKLTLGWEIESLFEKDVAKIGSDLMFQKLWKKAAPNDVFILHSDMAPFKIGWLDEVKKYVEKYPDAGMFGCKLVYPAKQNDKIIIQCAGGQFVERDGNIFPDHFGSGLDLMTNRQTKELTVDEGQYDCVREVAWTTFGGLYIRREVINEVGDFDPNFEWTYNRDVDYCLSARDKGWKIYQIPTMITHFESKDNKRLRQQNPELNEKEGRNLKRLWKKWKDSPLFKTIEIRVDDPIN